MKRMYILVPFRHTETTFSKYKIYNAIFRLTYEKIKINSTKPVSLHKQRKINDLYYFTLAALNLNLRYGFCDTERKHFLTRDSRCVQL